MQNDKIDTKINILDSFFQLVYFEKNVIEIRNCKEINILNSSFNWLSSKSTDFFFLYINFLLHKCPSYFLRRMDF